MADRDGDTLPEPEAIEVPEDFAALSEDDLRALHGRLQERWDALRPEARTPAQVEELRTIRAAQGRIASTLTDRQAEAEAVQTDLTALDADVPGLPDPGAPRDAEVPRAEDQPHDAGPATVPARAAAAPTAAEIAALREPQTAAQQRPSTVPARPRMAFRAAAGQNVVAHNADMELGDIGRVIDEIKKGVRAGNPVHIASLPAYEDIRSQLGVELLSDALGQAGNDRLIREAVEAWRYRRDERMGRNPARTAAICDPLDILRLVPDYSNDSDPFGDAFPQRPIGRLGFQYTPELTLAEVALGVQAGWDDTDQALVNPDDSSTWKPCIDIDCPPVSSVRAAAVTACFGFPITTEMSNPERVADFMRKLSAQRARARTQYLLGITDALSVQYLSRTSVLGSWSDVVYGIESILARAVYGERQDVEDYTVFLPPGLAEAFVADIQAKAWLAPEEVAAAAADLRRRLATVTGTEIVQLRDELLDPFGALPAVGLPTALPDFPSDPTIRILPPGAFIYGTTGEVSTGIQSSPELARQNRRQWFSEEFVLMAKHGSPPAFTWTPDLCPNGSRADLATGRTCSG